MPLPGTVPRSCTVSFTAFPGLYHIANRREVDQLLLSRTTGCAKEPISMTLSLETNICLNEVVEFVAWG